MSREGHNVDGEFELENNLKQLEIIKLPLAPGEVCFVSWIRVEALVHLSPRVSDVDPRREQDSMIAFPPVSESSSYLIVLSQATGLCTEELEKLRGEIALIAVMYGCDAEANREDVDWELYTRILLGQGLGNWICWPL